ncbi:hypothetical protein HDE_11536 [Halotydeus destructor]|nr:hypothetical protein HDE_11536 [Halotydeus destructor]
MAAVTVKQVQWIVMDLNGPLATKEAKLMSNDKKKFYKSKLSTYVNDEVLWHRKKGEPKSGSLKFDYNSLRMNQQKRIMNKVQDANEPVLPEFTKPKIKESLIKFINYNLEKNREYIGLFLVNMINWGIDKNLYMNPVYDEVRDVLEKWRKKNIKLALKVLKNANYDRWLRTNKGYLKPYFAASVSPYPDPGRGEKKCEEKELDYRVVAEKLECEAVNILYLTRELPEARLARMAGLQVILVARKDYDPDYQKEQLKAETLKKQQTKSKELDLTSADSLDIFKSGAISDNAKDDVCDLPSLIEAGNSEEAAQEMASAFKDFIAPTSQITAEGIVEFPIVWSLNDINFA